MNITEILKELRAGKKLTLVFESDKERESFRIRLYKTKSPEDKILEDVLDLDKMVLKFVKSEVHLSLPDFELTKDVTKYIAKIWLENKPSEPDFEVTSIEE